MAKNQAINLNKNILIFKQKRKIKEENENINQENKSQAGFIAITHVCLQSTITILVKSTRSTAFT
jgi:hypothetical protein